MAALALSLSIPIAALAQMLSAAATQAPALKIVVLKGEDAVNIIQQKTAVAPLVEVRDRNNLPVSGAVVTFTVGGGQGATFGGATTLTVTTNAAGQAAAAGFTPTAAGAIQVNATAVFQGNTAIATITQTNVMTAAEAAGAAGGSSAGSSGGGGGAGASAGGGAAAAGGGLSAAAIGGIVGGAAVGAGLGIKAASGGSDGGSSNTNTSSPTANTPTTAPTTSTTTTTTVPATTSVPGSVTGTYNGAAYTETFTVDPTLGSGGYTCTINANWNLTGRLSLSGSSTNVGGTGDLSGNQTIPSHNCSTALPGVDFGTVPFQITGPISGTASSLTFRQDLSQTIPIAGSSPVVITGAITFTGSLSNNAVSGTVTITYNSSSAGTPGVGGGYRATATGSFPITMR